MQEDLLVQIENKMSTFSKSQKLIANYIINSYEKAAYMTALKLGNAVNVSESTVVRFAIEMGFEGYPELQKSLQSLIKNRLTAVQRINITNDRIGDDGVLKNTLTQDMDRIRRTLEPRAPTTGSSPPPLSFPETVRSILFNISSPATDLPVNITNSDSARPII